MTGLPWVKWFAGAFLNGVADLDPNEIAVYAIVLNLIYDGGGPIADDVPKIARRCNMRPSSCAKALDGLVAAGKIQRQDGTITNPRAEKELKSRREVSEKSAQSAAARWGKVDEKANKINAGDMRTQCEGTATAYASKKLELEVEEGERASAPAPDEVKAAFEAFNQVATHVGWPTAKTLDARRRSAIKARLGECGGIDGWRSALARAKASPFLMGDNDRGWKADLDFFLQAKSFTRLLEGAYDARTPKRAIEPSAPAEPASPMSFDDMVRLYDRGLWGNRYGGEPGRRSCSLPDDLQRSILVAAKGEDVAGRRWPDLFATAKAEGEAA